MSTLNQYREPGSSGFVLNQEIAMGLFDQVGGILGGESGKLGQAQSVLKWVEEQGGISSLLDKFRQGGLSAVVESWVGNGNNQPISGEQIQSVLGIPAVAQLAEKLGIDADSASSLIAQYLPQVVDGLSPNGEVESHGDLASQGLNLLKGKLFG